MLINRLISIISMQFLFIMCLYSQSELIDWNENITDDEGMNGWRKEYEELVELAENPFNINTITAQQLKMLPFLSDSDIENILKYVDKYAPLVSKKELFGVEGLDWQTRVFLEDFIYIGPYNKVEKFEWKHMMKYNKQELTTRVDIPLNQKAGYADYPPEVIVENPNKKYYGSPVYNNVRYRFGYDDKVYFGLTAEKDAGEPFFRLYNKKGYDFYSAYLYLANIGRFKHIAIGNYKASYGYGLVINMGFNMGKSISSSALMRTGNGITKYTSTGEYDYLQGLSVGYKLSSRFDMTVFYSFRKMDALIDNMLISSLKTDGYHRLPKDMEKKNTVRNNLIGCNLNYNGKHLEIGLTAVYNLFDKKLSPEYRSYNHYYPRGKGFFNAGVYYKIFLNKVFLSGETAIDKKGTFATINSLRYSPSADTDINIINRYYDKRYQSIYACSFGENSKTQNELGLYIGVETSIIPKVKLLSYVDLFYFPWYRYRVDALKTSGLEGVFQLSYSHSNSLTMLIKYNYKNKALNYTSAAHKKYVLPYIRQRLRYQLYYKFPVENSVKFTADYTNTGYWKQETSHGFALSGSANMSFKSIPLRVSVSGGWFSTQDYNSRIYLNEPGLLYSFPMMSFYGSGFRTGIKLQYEIQRKLSVQCKYGWTHYTDRNVISSGTEEIQGNNKADIQFQLRFKW